MPFFTRSLLWARSSLPGDAGSLLGENIFLERGRCTAVNDQRDLIDAGDILSREDRWDLHIAEKSYFGFISSEMKIFGPAGVYF
jgi:hypothetical protein